jgi:tetratricopeptide (TPR) repeat protein
LRELYQQEGIFYRIFASKVSCDKHRNEARTSLEVYSSVLRFDFHGAQARLFSTVEQCLVRDDKHVLQALRNVVLYMGRDLPEILSYTSSSQMLCDPQQSSLFHQSLFESCLFADIENLHGKSSSADPRTRLLRVLALAFEFRFEEAERLIRECLEPQVLRNRVSHLVDYLKFLLSYPDIDDFGFDRKKAILSALECSASSPPMFDEFNHQMRLLESDEIMLLSFLEQMYISVSREKNIWEWQLSNFVSSNLFITYIRRGDFENAQRIWNSFGTERLSLGFHDGNDFKKFRFHVHLNVSQERHLVIRDLISVVEKNRERFHGSAASQTVVHSDPFETILWFHLYQQSEYQQLHELFLRSDQLIETRTPASSINAGHLMFVLHKYEEAIAFYKRSLEIASLVEVPPSVIGNLCVGLLILDRNDEASHCFGILESSSELELHCSVTDLLIGLLYCSRGNFNFGLERIIRAVLAKPSKILEETWSYVKTGLLGLLDIQFTVATMRVSDSVLSLILAFLADVIVRKRGSSLPMNVKIRNEAIVLESLFLRLYGKPAGTNSFP